MKRDGRGRWIALLPTPPGMREAQGLSRLPGGLFFGYFLLATHKFVWNEFEQPQAGPKGESHGWFS